MSLGALSPSLGTRYPFLGEALKFLRENAGLTQDQVAEKSGLDSTYISTLENGKGNPTFTTLKALGNGMGVGWSEIATLEEVFAKRQSKGKRRKKSK